MDPEIDDVEFKRRMLALGYPDNTFDIITKNGLKRIGHTHFESPQYPVSVDVSLTEISVGVYFGTSRGGLLVVLQSVFERHFPFDWTMEKDTSYLRYWEKADNRHKSCDEAKWYQLLREAIQKLMH